MLRNGGHTLATWRRRRAKRPMPSPPKRPWTPRNFHRARHATAVHYKHLAQCGRTNRCGRATTSCCLQGLGAAQLKAAHGVWHDPSLSRQYFPGSAADGTPLEHAFPGGVLAVAVAIRHFETLRQSQTPEDLRSSPPIQIVSEDGEPPIAPGRNYFQAESIERPLNAPLTRHGVLALGA